MNSLKEEIKIYQDASNSLAENLFKLLDSHKISESNLAKQLNIPYNTIRRILTGVTTDPRISTLEQIADFFGVKLDYLLNRTTQTREDTIKVPILNWDLVSEPNFLVKLDRLHWEKTIPVAQLENQKSADTLFALESTKSMQPRFPLGTIFIIAINEQPIDGDLILIRFKGDNKVSLRELAIDSPYWQLNAIISGSKVISFNYSEHSIVGIVTLTLIQTRFL